MVRAARLMWWEAVSGGASSAAGGVSSGGVADGGVAGGAIDVAGGGSAGAGGAGSPSGQLYVIDAGFEPRQRHLRFASPPLVNSNRAPAAKISGPASTLHCAHLVTSMCRENPLGMYVADPCPPAGLMSLIASARSMARCSFRAESPEQHNLAIGPLVGNDTMMAVALDSSRDILYVSTAKQDNTVGRSCRFVGRLDGKPATSHRTHIITTPPDRRTGMLNFNHGVMLDSANDRLYVASIAAQLDPCHSTRRARSTGQQPQRAG